jgi:hypothetical protein
MLAVGVPIAEVQTSEHLQVVDNAPPRQQTYYVYTITILVCMVIGWCRWTCVVLLDLGTTSIGKSEYAVVVERLNVTGILKSCPSESVQFQRSVWKAVVARMAPRTYLAQRQ